jgi:hypothetical protein
MNTTSHVSCGGIRRLSYLSSARVILTERSFVSTSEVGVQDDVLFHEYAATVRRAVRFWELFLVR